MFLRKKNLKFFLRRNIECTPSILYIYFFFGIFVSLYATCIIT